jgi:coenzyme F420 biosynthesis associated uncharacterized protein
MSDSLVDWRLARRVAAGVAGSPDGAERRAAALRPEALAASCARAEELVRGYARLDPVTAIPGPEAIGRREWSEAVLGTLRELALEIERESDLGVSLPGPFGRVARSLLGAATGTEVGLATGYAARRVLGQYDVALVGAERPARLLFVTPNIAGFAAEIDTALDPFVRWVALHETTHALQFAAAPWLREHLGGLVRRLLSGVMEGAGLSDLLRRIISSPKDAISSFLRGNLAAAIAGAEQAPLLDRIQATMTVIEGHAEHVMDAAAADFVPGVGELRRRIERRRSGRGPVETIVGRVLGLDLKLRQYRLGKGFCDAVAERGGVDALNRIWSGPDALPDLAELEAPALWLERIGAGSGAAA